MADAATDAAPDPAPRDAISHEVADEAFWAHVEGLVSTWRLGEALERLERLPGIVPAVARQLLEDVVHRLHLDWPLHLADDEETLPAAGEG